MRETIERGKLKQREDEWTGTGRLILHYIQGIASRIGPNSDVVQQWASSQCCMHELHHNPRCRHYIYKRIAVSSSWSPNFPESRWPPERLLRRSPCQCAPDKAYMQILTFLTLCWQRRGLPEPHPPLYFYGIHFFRSRFKKNVFLPSCIPSQMLDTRCGENRMKISRPEPIQLYISSTLPLRVYS